MYFDKPEKSNLEWEIYTDGQRHDSKQYYKLTNLTMFQNGTPFAEVSMRTQIVMHMITYID